MAQRRPQAEVHARSASPTAGKSAAKRTRQDPLVDAIAREFDLSAPGIGPALRRLQIMRQNGEDVTLDIARAVLRTFIEYHAHLEQKAEEKMQGAVVYYMRLGDMVKIGWTTNLESRRSAINPQEVMATEPGNDKLERQRHKQFAELRIHGEWFKLEAPLTEWIESLREVS